MTNFDFLVKDKQFESFSGVAVAAEKTLHIDLSTCIINCRRAMEMAVKWMYSVDSSLVMPWQDTLVSLMNTEEFRDIVGTDIWRRMDFIRRVGNNAAHTGKKVTEEQAMLCLENLYIFAATYGYRPNDYYYATVEQIFEYEDAIKAITVEDGKVINNSESATVYFTVCGERVTLAPMSAYTLESGEISAL